MTNQLLDPEVVSSLLELGKDDPDFLPGLTSLFFKNSAEKIAEIDVLMKAGKWKEVAALCHQLKSSSGNFGATNLQELFAQLEAEAGEDGRARIQDLWSRIRAEHPLVTEEIKKRLLKS